MELRTHEEIMNDLFLALEKGDVKKADFATHIGISPTNVKRLKEKKELPLARFLKAVEILNLDIIKLLVGKSIDDFVTEKEQLKEELSEGKNKIVELQGKLIKYLEEDKSIEKV